jgi:hypothetical protein
MTNTASELKAQLAATIAADLDLNNALQNLNFEDRFAEEERRGQRDPRTGRFLRHSDYGGDDQLVVNFTTVAVLNKLESYKAGSPKYQDMDFITIIIPGNKDLTYHGPVTDFYEWRFPREYEAFKAGKGHVVQGTPLSSWMELTASQVKELEYHGIKTIEQVANLSDSTSGILRSFYNMKEKAKHFLEIAKDTEKTSLMTMQLADQESKHKAEMAELNAKMLQLMEMVSANNKPEPEVKASKTKV